MAGRKKEKKPIRAHSRGSASHNRSHEPGKLMVTIWGVTDKEPKRKVALTLGEEDVKLLVAALGRYGFYA